MDNALVGFKKYNGKKSDLLNVTVEPGDIIFGIDSETKLPYIYHNGVFYSDASEWSEALPEIHIGPTMSPEKDPYIKLWVDTDDNPPTLKYKNSDTNDWEDVSSNIDITETNEIFIGDNLPADISDNIKVWYQTNVDLPEEDTVVSWEDVENKPPFANVAFTGSYTDLKDVPDTIKKTYYAHGQIDRTKYHLTNEQLIDNINTQKSIENKEEANYIIHVVDTDKYYTANKVSQESSYVKTLYAVVFEDDDDNIGNDIVNPIVTSVKLNIYNGEILGGIPSGGSGEAFVDSAYLSTKGYVNSHTTTYIGTENPSTISSKYNLWVDISKEEVVFKYKDTDNTWQILSTGGSGNIEVDTELKETSENPIANKVVYNMAVTIEQAMASMGAEVNEKAKSENGLVEGRGFKVTDNLKYYLPDTVTSAEPTVDDNHIIATKADVLSNEVIDSKATVYNLYAMDDLTAEQLAANETAFGAVQNGEVALYRVYTDDTAYALADVKIVGEGYLEAYVYVNTPNTTDKQATITKYTYSFDQTGEYLPSDKDVEEIVVPSIDKVNELIGSGGTGGSSEVPYFTTYDAEHNQSVIQSITEGNALPTSIVDENGFPYTISNYGVASDNKGLLLYYYGSYESSSVRLVSPSAFLLTFSGEVTVDYVDKPVVEFSTDNVITFKKSDDVLKYITITRSVGAVIRPIIKIHVKNNVIAVADCVDDTYEQPLKVEYNVGNKRYCNIYDCTTGELTETKDITPTAGGGSESSGGTKTYTVYCELSEDEAEKAKQLESNITAYNACMSNDDALYTIFLEDGLSTITSVGVPFENYVVFVGDLILGDEVISAELAIYADGTVHVEEYNFSLSNSGVQVYFLDTTTTEKTIEGVSKIIEYISAGKSVTVVWYKGDEYITTCSDVALYVNGIVVGIQEAGAYSTYIIKNTGEITQFLKVGTLKLNHSTVENERNKEAVGPLSILFSGASDLKGGVSLSILHKPNYYQVLHTKKVDDSYKMKVILDDNSFGTYTLQSNGILTLDS